ncbi:hypothetical protein GQ600_10139 [Phytophthora cactorum]|nr:hypothetical protein GQ600_10139 [Phytophthora cactorum]
MIESTKTKETTGKATFRSQRDALFRFTVTPAKIWLEQQTTKQQWSNPAQCTVSSVSDFALKGAGIPHGIVIDYLAICLTRWNSSRDTDYEIDLIPMSEGRIRLDFLLKFSIADVVWKPEYQFVLQPIEVTETQMLLAKLQDTNGNLDHLHSIVPAWVVEANNPTVPRNSAVMQIVALKGAHSWLYLCSLTKQVLENSGNHVETALEWGSTAAQNSTEVVTKYWSVFWATTKHATGTVRQLVLDQYATMVSSNQLFRNFVSHPAVPFFCRVVGKPSGFDIEIFDTTQEKIWACYVAPQTLDVCNNASTKIPLEKVKAFVEIGLMSRGATDDVVLDLIEQMEGLVALQLRLQFEIEGCFWSPTLRFKLEKVDGEGHEKMELQASIAAMGLVAISVAVFASVANDIGTHGDTTKGIAYASMKSYNLGLQPHYLLGAELQV